MKPSYKILIGLLISTLGFWFLVGAHEVLAGQCQIRVNYQAQPNPVPENGVLNLSGYIDFNGSQWEPPGSPDVGYCKVGTTVVRYVMVQFAASGSGFTTGAAALGSNQRINLETNRTVAYGFQATFKPADRGLKAGSNFITTAKFYTGGSTGFRQQISASTPITVNIGASVFGAFGCLVQNAQGQNVYACSPTNNSSCSDVPNNACQGKPCVALGDSRLCTGPVTTTHKECRNNACVIISGPGQYNCPNNCAPPGPGGPGTPTTYNFSLRPPTGIETFQDLVNVIGRWIFNLAIPIAVIMIIWAGVLMLTAGGKPEQFKKGMTALKYAVIGLAIVLIGKGFVSLIKSILDLRNP